MKIFFLTLIFLLPTLYLSASGIDDSKQKGKLIIKFDGLKNDKGNLIIALCNSSENYKVDERPFIGKNVKLNDKSIAVEFDDLPFGEYAVKAFHDENGNNKFDTNFIGIPTEDYGFSNNARGTFGPPSWEDAKFSLKNSSQSIEILIK